MKTYNCRPIYIIGSSRSGTSMVAFILGQNKKIFSFKELHFFEQFWSGHDAEKVLPRNEAEHLGARLLSHQREGYYLRKDYKKYLIETKKMLDSLNENELSSIRIYHSLLLYETRRNGKQYPCEQTPRNVFYIREILENFPCARVIHMVRDPRAVMLSQKRKWKRRYLGKNFPLTETIRSWFNFHPIVISKLWNNTIRSVHSFAQDRRILTVQFEHLLQKPEKTIQRICDFLSVQYRYDMLDVPQVGSSNIPDNTKGRGINAEVSDFWQKDLDAVDIYWCQKINKSLMELYGYTLSNIKPNFMQLMISALVLILKLPVVFLINVKRTKNVVLSIKKRFL